MTYRKDESFSSMQLGHDLMLENDQALFYHQLLKILNTVDANIGGKKCKSSPHIVRTYARELLLWL